MSSLHQRGQEAVSPCHKLVHGQSQLAMWQPESSQSLVILRLDRDGMHGTTGIGSDRGRDIHMEGLGLRKENGMSRSLSSSRVLEKRKGTHANDLKKKMRDQIETKANLECLVEHGRLNISRHFPKRVTNLQLK